MADLPSNTDMTGSAVTQGGFKARLNDVLDYLRDILGTTGTPAAARTALGLGALATKADVAAADIATGAVTADKIGTDAVTSAKVASGAVTTGKIADGAVTTAKIAAGAVTDGLLAANAVTAGKIADGAVGTGKVGDAAVTAAKIAAAAIGTTHIADGAVTLAKLGGGAMSVSVVAEANITSGVGQVDLSLPSGPAMFLLMIGDLRPASAAGLRMRTSADGVNFDAGAGHYRTFGATAVDSLTYIELSAAINLRASDDYPWSGSYVIFPGAVTTPWFTVRGMYEEAPGTAPITGGVARPVMGARAAAGRQQAIRLFMGAGNVNRGTIRLIGVT